MVERIHRHGDGDAPDELGDHPELDKVLWLYEVQQVGLRVALPIAARGKAEGTFDAHTPRDDIFDTGEHPANDEENVLRVDLDELLMRVLAPALRRDVRHRAFDDLQERLLHTLAADIAREGGVVATLARGLVDLVDVDDAALGTLDVVVSRLDEPQQDVLHILTDVACLGQRGGVCDAERHIEHTRERLGQQRLTDAGRAHDQDVALVDLDALEQPPGLDPLIVVINGDGEHSLGAILPDDILVQMVVDLLRRGQFLRQEIIVQADGIFLAQDLLAQVHALIADEHALGTGDQAPDFALWATAERTVLRAPVISMHKKPCLFENLLLSPCFENAVDQTVLNRFLRRQEDIALGIFRNLLDRLPGMMREDGVQALAQAQDLPCLDLDVGGLTLRAAERLVQVDRSVRQCEPAALRAGGQQDGAEAGREPDRDGADRRGDLLHRVVDAEARVDHAAG